MAATKDGVVRNDYIRDYAKLCRDPSSEYHEVLGADHTDVCFDERYGSHLIRASRNFFNKLIRMKSDAAADQ